MTPEIQGTAFRPFEKSYMQATHLRLVSYHYGYPDEYFKARHWVLERDNFRCIHCGRRGSLHVHHLDCNKDNDSYDNLVTLCIDCHYGTHLRDGWLGWRDPAYVFKKLLASSGDNGLLY